MSLLRAALGKLAFVSTLAALLPSGFGAEGIRRLARAQDAASAPRPLDRMKALNDQAVLDYAAEDYESAQLGLREAIAMGQRAGMGSDAFMARLFANLGAVYISGLKDEKRGSRALESALAVEPDIQLTDTLATPELREIFSRLRSRAQKTQPGGRAPANPLPDGGSAPVNSPAAPLASPSPPGSTGEPGPAPAFPPAGGSAPAVRSTEPDARPPTGTVAIVPPPPPLRRREVMEEPDLPARVPQPLYCPTPDEAPPSQGITLNCVLQPEVSASKVLLYYRPPGARRFTSTSTVRSSKGWYRGIIPGDVVQGRSLHFYFEARGTSDEVVGRAGRDDSPNIVLIRVGAPTSGGGLYAGVQYRRLAGDSAAPGPEEDPLVALAERERQPAPGSRRAAGTPYFGLGLGRGHGYHGTQRLEFYGDAIIEKGWIPSGLVHLTPEIGYQWNESFALSLLARLQFISQSGSGDMRPGSPARGAYAVLARPQYLLGPGNLQFNLSGYLGAGDGFRLTVDPQPPKFRRNDSVRGGPIVTGAGLGLLFHVSRHLAAALDGRWLFGFPDFATVADLGFNIQLGF